VVNKQKSHFISSSFIHKKLISREEGDIMSNNIQDRLIGPMKA